MDTPDTALRGQNTTAGGRLYMAFELGEKNWKLSLGDGQRAPSRFTVAAGDTTAVLTAIANAKARCHLSKRGLLTFEEICLHPVFCGNSGCQG